MPGIRTYPLLSTDDSDWLHMRVALWPEGSAREHVKEMAGFLTEPDRFAQFVVRDDEGAALGFIEASVRTDDVNGTSTSPVAYLEGLYVRPKARRQGVARALVQAVAHWARGRGCEELASDALLSNRTSQAAHKGLGFAETERVVHFNLRLG
ncbi:MAG: aminoglycoside 6'-acetyltransferase [Comamonadaceae bacterium]|nr:aminoglycoside 6'-acetyltransferase [Comamonadaceae bacterium]